jgi:pyruvate dehydrogenase E2 component (dihydrolipoamide acetyltransferase)
VARVLRMPEVAANATDAVLMEWLVEESGDFAAFDALATVETAKAAVDVEADADGRVLKTLVPPGAQVEVGDPIAVLGEPGERVDDLAALLRSLGVAEATDVVVPQRRDLPTDPSSAAPLAEATQVAAAPDARDSTGPLSPRRENAHGRVFASPLARKLAKDNGLSVDELTGTGPRGRILRRDVDAVIASRSHIQEGTPTHADYEEVPHSRIRRATAHRLVESKQTAPHFYVRATVRAEALVALRADLNAGGQARVSLNDLVVKGVAAAHERVPDMNVTWTADAVRRYASVDIAVAVSTERGLVTPVVRDVTRLTVRALSSRVQDLAGRAREGKLRQEELEGGSIAVTNLGMFGVEEFTAIINPPQAAILAVGSVREEPVVEDGAVVPGRVMTVTLSVDHRPVDGVLAARWLSALVELLEHPVWLLA